MPRENVQVIEKGDIYFFFRPANTAENVSGLIDVQRFYMLLNPDGKDEFREIVVGKKKLPDVERNERFFAYIDRVYKNSEEARKGLNSEDEKTSAPRDVRDRPAWAAGEGRYVLAEHEDHTHLAYALELPKEPKEVQHDLRIESEGGYVIAVSNPATGEFLTGETPEYPQEVLETFEPDHRFARRLRPEMLDYENAEMVLIGASEDPVDELGIEFDTKGEDLAQSDLVNDLKMEKGKKRLEPVEEGSWD